MIRWIMFMLMGAWVGIVAALAPPPATICACVIAFGYGVDCIATAIEERR